MHATLSFYAVFTKALGIMISLGRNVFYRPEAELFPHSFDAACVYCTTICVIKNVSKDLHYLQLTGSKK